MYYEKKAKVDEKKLENQIRKKVDREGRTDIAREFLDYLKEKSRNII